jgi:tetratricopeptide (TPR) repeat protein/class 3 adenylate cyclase
MGRDRQTGWSDPEEAAALLRPFLALASELGATFGGHVLSSSSGTVQMVFGYPAAREDDPAQAVRAGLALVHAVARLESLDRAGLSARAGIATGLAVIGSEAEPGGRTKTEVAGDVQAAAYDVLTLADPGTVALSDATRGLLRGAFGLRVIETGTGRNGWQVTSLRDDAGHRAAQRRDAPARRVGRDEEFELLCRRLEQSRAGSGRVVLIAGEAGIGKSRLVGDVLETPSAQEMGLLRYACSEHDRNRPLHPFINRLEWREGMLAARSVEERRDHLEAYVCSASRNPERDMALICDLLGLPDNGRYAALSVSPAQKRELLVSAFLEWIAALATKSPLVLHFEDVHWIDPSSQDLLARAVDLVASWPVLLVATMRPDHRPGWISQPHVTMLHLSRFGPVESAELVGVVAGETRLPGPVVEQIVERADGVPLYIKELTRHVLDNRSSGAEATDPQQRPAQNTVPVSLQSSLVARLDQSAAFRKVALAASAIGRSFSFELIAAAVDMPDEVLAETLDHMTAAGLILQTGTMPFSKYAFAHALMREAAYGMLLRSQRQALHSRIADRLIGPFSTSPENSPATIARHLSEAGRTTEAVNYYVTAAEIAQRRWANREAADLLDLAIAAHNTLPDSPEMRRQAIDLRFKTKNALIPLADFDRILERLAEARRLVDRHGDERRLCQFFVHISQSLGLSGRATEAIAHGRDAVVLAGRLGDRQLLTEAKVFLGTAQYMVADYLGAKASFLDVLDLVSTAPPDTHYLLASFPDITAGAFLAKTLATLGEFDEGQRHGVEAVRRGAAMRQPYSQSIALWCLGDLHLARGEIAKAIGHFEDGLEIARQWDLPTMVAGHTGSLGHAYVLSGNVDAGLPMLEQALSAFDRMRHHLGLSLFLVPLAAASVLAGNAAQARALAARALDLARNGHRCGEAGARYVLAEAEVRDGEPSRALNHYAEALDLALTRGMRPLAASCHHGLGEAYRRLGDETSARDSLGLAAALHLELGMFNATDHVGQA